MDSGFDPQAVTTWIWEGVIPCMTEPQVRSAPRRVRSLRTAALRSAMRVVLRPARQPDPLADEPRRSLWRPADLRTLFHESRFEVETDDDLLAAQRPGGDRDPPMRQSVQPLTVSVATP